MSDGERYGGLSIAFGQSRAPFGQKNVGADGKVRAEKHEWETGIGLEPIVAITGRAKFLDKRVKIVEYSGWHSDLMYDVFPEI